ncbi:hypothetical protein H1R20_g16680, partial [Candolleomyces eurysporus]
MSNSFDIFTFYHEVVGKLTKHWTPGMPPATLTKPAMFLGSTVKLVLAMHRDENKAILEYAGARALVDWFGAVSSVAAVDWHDQLSADEMSFIEDLPGDRTPSILPAHSSVPASREVHELLLSQKAASSRSKGKGPQQKASPGSRLYSLTGSPTDRYFDNSYPLFLDVYLAKTSGSKKSKKTTDEGSENSRKRPPPASPSSSEFKEKEPASKQPPAKRSRRNAEASSSRTTRRGTRGRQPSPIIVDEEPRPVKSSKKTRAPSPSSSEEEEEEDVEETDPVFSEPPPASRRQEKKPVPVKKPAPRPAYKGKGREVPQPTRKASGPQPPSDDELREAHLGVDPETRDLSSRALEIYEGLLPKSVFVTSPEAARLLATRTSSGEIKAFPCNYRGCLTDPASCVPSTKNSQKCGPCQDKGYQCSWTYDPHDFRHRLASFWSAQRRGFDVFQVNSLHRQMRDEWESYRTFQALANREATKFEVTRRLLVGYLNQAAAEGDANVDELVDSSVLAVASTHFPPVLREERAEVPSVSSFLRPGSDLSNPGPDLPPDFFGPGNTFDSISAEDLAVANPDLFNFFHWPQQRGGQLIPIPNDPQAESSRRGAQPEHSDPEDPVLEAAEDPAGPADRAGSAFLPFSPPPVPGQDPATREGGATPPLQK